MPIRSKITQPWELLFFIWFCVFVIFLPVSKAIVQICVVGLLATGILMYFFAKEKSLIKEIYQRNPLSGSIAIFIFCTLASAAVAIFAGYPKMTVFRGVLKILEWFLLFFAAAEIFHDENRRNSMTRLIFITAIVMVFDGLFQLIFGWDLFLHRETTAPFSIPRIRGPFGSDNMFSSYLIMTMPFIFIFFRNVSNKRSLVMRLLIVALTLFVFAQTRTRSAWIGFLFGLITLFFLQKNKRMQWALAVLMICVTLIPASLNIVNRHIGKTNGLNIADDEVVFRFSVEEFKERTELWSMALHIVKAHPLLGSGPNTYDYEVNRNEKGHARYGRIPYAHNSYLQITSELGLVGLFAFLFVLWRLLRILVKSLRSKGIGPNQKLLQEALLISLSGMTVKAFLDTDFQTMQCVDFFWFLAGLAVGNATAIERASLNTEERVFSTFKVLHIGNGQSIRHLIKPHMEFQRRQGYEVSAISSLNADDEVGGVKVKRISFEEQKIHLFRDGLEFIKLVRAILEENPDIVHTHNVKFGVFGRLAAKLANVPYVIHTAHGIYRPFDASKSRVFMIDLLERTCNACADAILFVSRFDLQKYVQAGVAPAEKSFFIGNGISLKRFDKLHYSFSETEAKKKELGILPGEKIIGIVCRLVADKGVKEFFQAAQKIAAVMPAVRFIVIALSYSRNDSVPETIASEYGVQDRVIFLYDRMDMPLLYSVMDVLVHPSWREGFPRALMEAAAMQVPIVASDIEGNRNVVEPGKTGILFPVKDVEALVQNCLWVFQYAEEARGMAAEAGIKAKTEFDENQMFRIIEEAYRALLEKNPKREVVLTPS